ncbi:MAG: NAD-dependent deacylase, partial [Anaerolineales bacterium]|nr:NAD-dependent deacylase [Anaerolineales bacterium]
HLPNTGYNKDMEIQPELAEKISHAQYIVALTGAGVSAESGIPTFREAQTGLWARYNPMELATPQAFQRNPKLVWEWYQWRRQLIAGVKPNQAHHALAELARRVPQFTLITQNIDGLHRQAGSQNIIELHGDITKTKCFDHHHPVSNWENSAEIPPRCPQCGSLLRPDVVWFGENLPQEALAAAFSASESAQVFLSIGTSSLVEPAASLPLIASQNGAILIEINPAATPISHLAQLTIRHSAAASLPTFVDQLWPERI